MLYLAKADPLMVLRDLLGHSSVLTTEKYLRRLDMTRIYRDACERAGAGAGCWRRGAEREAGAEFAATGAAADALMPAELLERPGRDLLRVQRRPAQPPPGRRCPDPRAGPGPAGGAGRAGPPARAASMRPGTVDRLRPGVRDMAGFLRPGCRGGAGR